MLGCDGRPATAALLVLIRSQRAAASPQQGEELRRLYGSDRQRLHAATALAFGVRLALDAQGRTRLLANATDQLVALGVDGVATAAFVADPPGGSLQLRLKAQRVFHVAVTKADGSPAIGVPVGIGAARWCPALVVTGTDGTATVPEPEIPNVDASRLRLYVKVPAQQPIERPLPAAAAETVRFQLPACGSLRVTLANADPKTARVELVVPGPISRFPPTAVDDKGFTFAFVEAGEDVVVDTFIGVGPPYEVLVPAVEAGKETPVTVDLARAPPQLSFRVLDAAGVPVANTKLAMIWELGTWRSTAELQTDAEGRALLTAYENVVADGQLWIEQRPADGWNNSAVACAEVPIHGLPRGRHELTDVRLQLPPVLVSGHFVDCNGNPVAGVQVTASGDRDSFRSGPSAADGSFAIRTRQLPPKEVQLSMNPSDGFLVADPGVVVAYAVPATGLRLVVRRAALLLVHLASIPPDAHSRLWVECVAAGAAGAQFEMQLTAKDRHLAVPPGKWDLVFRFERGSDEVFRIEGVSADEGVEVHDARLMDLDWTRFARLTTVTVTGPDGKPCDDCELWRVTTAASSGIHPRQGVARLLVQKDGAVILVRPNNSSLRTVELSPVKAEHSVQLREWPKIRVQFSPLPKLPPGTTLWFSMDDDKATPGVDAGAGEMDGNGLAEIPLVKSGARSLRLHVLKRQGTSRSSIKLGVDPLVMHVAEDNVDHKFTVTPELQAAIDEACSRF